MNLMWVALGGACGSLLRYLASGTIYLYLGASFPYGTLFVNILGSFIIGVLSELVTYFSWGPSIRSFLLIGLLGGFTTFSSYSIETVNLFRDGEIIMASLNLFLNNLLSISLALLGLVGTRFIIEHAL